MSQSTLDTLIEIKLYLKNISRIVQELIRRETHDVFHEEETCPNHVIDIIDLDDEPNNFPLLQSRNNAQSRRNDEAV
jgi:hypothetical protein